MKNIQKALLLSAVLVGFEVHAGFLDRLSGLGASAVRSIARTTKFETYPRGGFEHVVPKGQTVRSIARTTKFATYSRGGFEHVVPKGQRIDLTAPILAADQAYETHESTLEKSMDLPNSAGIPILGTTVFGQRDVAGLITHKDGQLLIAFHGTQGWGDILTDFTAYKTSAQFLGLQGSVHAGFSHLFQTFVSNLEDALKAAHRIWGICPLTVTGHSMGGALATIASAYLLKQGYDHRLVTIASPRVFNTRATHHYNQRMGEHNIVRLWRSGDLVSAVCMGWMGFKHVGSEGGYYSQSISWFNLAQNHAIGAWKKSVHALYTRTSYTSCSSFLSPWFWKFQRERHNQLINEYRALAAAPAT